MLTLPRIPIQYPNRSLADNNYLLGRSTVHLTFSRNRLRSWRFDGCSTCGTRGLRYKRFGTTSNRFRKGGRTTLKPSLFSSRNSLILLNGGVSAKKTNAPGKFPLSNCSPPAVISIAKTPIPPPISCTFLPDNSPTISSRKNSASERSWGRLSNYLMRLANDHVVA